MKELEEIGWAKTVQDTNMVQWMREINYKKINTDFLDDILYWVNILSKYVNTWKDICPNG